MTATLGRTALYDAHVALGARMVPFGGFEMPVQYAGVLKEHDAVRKRAGLFDLSHMGQFGLRGAEVGAWADRLTVNNVATMKPGAARYNIFTNEEGGAHDDVIFYRFTDTEWLLVVNASNAAKMWSHVSSQRGGDVELVDNRAKRALIALQGPKSVDIMKKMLDPQNAERVAGMKYYSCDRITVATMHVTIARTGYTGEDGFELFVDDANARALWDMLLERGAGEGLEPCGLGARDVLRLEAGMPLYGFEMDEAITPVQAGLGWVVKMTKPQFFGKAALEAQLAADTYSRIVGVVMDGRAPARSGYRVSLQGRDVGEIKSGSPSPTLGKNVATALVAPDAAAEGTKIDIDIRGTLSSATVVTLPFYAREKK